MEGRKDERTNERPSEPANNERKTIDLSSPGKEKDSFIHSNTSLYFTPLFLSVLFFFWMDIMIHT